MAGWLRVGRGHVFVKSRFLFPSRACYQTSSRRNMISNSKQHVISNNNHNTQQHQQQQQQHRGRPGNSQGAAREQPGRPRSRQATRTPQDEHVGKGKERDDEHTDNGERMTSGRKMAERYNERYN